MERLTPGFSKEKYAKEMRNPFLLREIMQKRMLLESILFFCGRKWRYCFFLYR